MQKAVLGAALFLFACRESLPDLGPTSTGAEAIVRGEVDSPERYPGIVYLSGNGFSCTGSIIDVNVTTGIGWVLTSAHCVLDLYGGVGRPFTEVRVGPNIDTAQVYTATRSIAHPRVQLDRIEIVGNLDPWPSAPTFDVAMVAFSGAGPELVPLVMRRLDPAEHVMAPGDPVQYAGFGVLDGAGTDTRLRHRSMNTISATSASTRERLLSLVVDQSGGAGGICDGDSGGPMMFEIGGEPRITGLNSGITLARGQPCDEWSIANDTAQLAPFIDGVLRGDPLDPPVSCLACSFEATTSGACQAEGAAMRTPAAYDFFYCVFGDTYGDCRRAHAAGARAYDALVACRATACAGQCDGSVRASIECGMALDGADCDHCMATATGACAASSACRADPACVVCLDRTDYARSCDTNVKFQAWRTAINASCRPVCDDELDYYTDVAPPTDAGFPDATPDAQSDVGFPDAASVDAGVSDSGATVADSGVVADVGTSPPTEEEDSGCSAAGSAKDLWSLALVLLWLTKARYNRSRTRR